MQSHGERLVEGLRPMLTVLYRLVEEGIDEARSFFDKRELSNPIRHGYLPTLCDGMSAAASTNATLYR